MLTPHGPSGEMQHGEPAPLEGQNAGLHEPPPKLLPPVPVPPLLLSPAEPPTAEASSRLLSSPNSTVSASLEAHAAATPAPSATGKANRITRPKPFTGF